MPVRALPLMVFGELFEKTGAEQSRKIEVTQLRLEEFRCPAPDLVYVPAGHKKSTERRYSSMRSALRALIR